jgi:ribosomal protein S7
LPSRKNDFTKRKEWILKKVADEIYLEGVYDDAKNILLNAAVAYEEQTGKQQVALFKNRKFDYEYLRIEIDKVLNPT